MNKKNYVPQASRTNDLTVVGLRPQFLTVSYELLQALPTPFAPSLNMAAYFLRPTREPLNFKLSARKFFLIN